MTFSAPGEGGTDSFRRNPGVLQQELDGEMLVLLPAGAQVVHLNDTASALWRILECPLTLPQAAAMLAQTYDAEPAQVLADLQAALPALISHEILLST